MMQYILFLKGVQEMNLSVKIFLSLVLSVVCGLIAGEPALPFIKAWILRHHLHQPHQDDDCTGRTD